jgi:hypothetical protein
MSTFQNEIDAIPFRLAPSFFQFNQILSPRVCTTLLHSVQLSLRVLDTPRLAISSHLVVDRCRARHHRHGPCWGAHEGEGLNFGILWLSFTPSWAVSLLGHVRYRGR